MAMSDVTADYKKGRRCLCEVTVELAPTPSPLIDIEMVPTDASAIIPRTQGLRQSLWSQRQIAWWGNNIEESDVHYRWGLTPSLWFSFETNIGTKFAPHLCHRHEQIASHLDDMTELTAKTWRAHRNLLERLKGYEKIYETKLTDGEKTAYGRGRTREESRRKAERNWLEQLDNDYASKQGREFDPGSTQSR